jgi:hypothetical protein|tara:strand:- start:105 stop:530 length:426 start_codon:yes stop_codon:yes gene_type:complete
MKKIAIPLLIIFSLISCKEQPTFCEKPYQVNEIKLVPTKHWSVGREITIKNDSLINFITQQICEIKDASWSNSTQGEGEVVEIQFSPNKMDENIYVVYRGLGDNDYRIREGTTYFKNDLLCELVFKLTGIEKNEKVKEEKN